jgi:unsaturated chondroitin disaccharide hydrolase
MPDPAPRRREASKRRGTQLKQEWTDYLTVALREHERSRTRDPRCYPHYSENGSWQLLDISTRSEWRDDLYEHGNWTAGFWFGTMWLTALGSGRDDVAELALARLPLLTERAEDHTTHDLGFLFHPSLVLGNLCGYVGDKEVEPALAAARMTARRFNDRGRYIQAFGPIGEIRSAPTSTIDTMMNLPLLWWAYKRTGDPQLLDVARHHARTSARLLVRPDGSTIHLMRLDPLTGAYQAESTLQGASVESAWSRGSGWAFAGLAWAFAVTGEPELLAAAERVAAYYADMAKPDDLPPWDFARNTPDAPRDASAAAAMALGHLLLGAAHPVPAARARHDRTGRDLLATLTDLALNRDASVDGILLQSCYSVPHGLGIAGATAWGDFYYGLAMTIAAEVLPVSRLLST